MVRLEDYSCLVQCILMKDMASTINAQNDEIDELNKKIDELNKEIDIALKIVVVVGSATTGMLKS